jgi:hypothetical protein
MRRKKRTDDAAAFEKLMWERQYLGGRFPEPSEEASADAQPPPSNPPHRRHLLVPSLFKETVRASSRATGVAGGNVLTK